MIRFGSSETTAPSLFDRAGALLSRAIPRLSFDEPLESQFSLWYAEHTRSRIRNAMWFAMGNIILVMLAGGPFRAMRDAIFGAENHLIVDALRFGVIAPSAAAMLIVSYSKLYRRWFGLTAQIVAPIHATSFVVMDLLMHPQGYSLSSCMPLIALAPYFLFGMLQAQAVRTSFIVVATYALGGYLAGITGPQRYFDLAVIAFAGALGAAVHYSFQKGVRRNYLATQVLSESVNRDSLTGIHNRRMFDEHMARLWQQATREQAPLALLLIDLDHFKAFNDHAGHQAGDICLTRVASLLLTAARRPLDLAARYGGEEFAVLLYDVRRDKAEEVCRQLHATLARAALKHPSSAVGPVVTFSIGAACIQPMPGRHSEGFIQLADEALYAAKERGRNRTVVMDREYESLTTGAFRVSRRSAA
ncbi:MAG: diguanylate cyclase domain-containing protein [Steroidobacter sp.]